MVEPGAVVRISPSQIEQMERCSLRWLLGRVGGQGGTAAPLQFGTAVHALAETMARRLGEQGRVPALKDIEDEVRRALRGVDSPAPWAARADEARFRTAVANVRTWLDEVADAWRATEVPVRVPLDDLVGRPAELVGRADQVLSDDAGRAVVVDVKTGKAAPGKADRVAADRHPQLGAYQVAASLGAFEHLGLRGAGGARLVFVATRDSTSIPPSWRESSLSVDQSPLEEADVEPGPPSRPGAAPDPAATAGAGAASGSTGLRPPGGGPAGEPAAAAGDAELGWAVQMLVRAVAVASGNAVSARFNDLCDRCEVRAACPLQVEGQQVTA
jgi:RecB family exonuclease